MTKLKVTIISSLLILALLIANSTSAQKNKDSKLTNPPDLANLPAAENSDAIPQIVENPMLKSAVGQFIAQSMDNSQTINTIINSGDDPFIVMLKKERAFGIFPAPTSEGTYSPNLVAGFGGNSISPGFDIPVGGAVIAGGGDAVHPNIANRSFAAVGGGFGNIAGRFPGDPHPAGVGTTVSGGIFNAATVTGAVVSGGNANVANGFLATIPGGVANVAFGNQSFAAGNRAQALHEGAFVWADSVQPFRPFSSTALNQFSVRATGGVRFASAVDAAGNSTAGVVLAPGGGSWSSLSDRNAKTNFASINPRHVLEKLAAMSIFTWNYKSQAATIRHLGPTAQDFRTAFGIGEDDTHISMIDADGVAFAAIQGLYQMRVEDQKTIDQLHAENLALQKRLAVLENVVQHHYEVDG